MIGQGSVLMKLGIGLRRMFLLLFVLVLGAKTSRRPPDDKRSSSP